MKTHIGMMGAKGAGKDTAASVLIEKLGYARIGFADELYKQAAASFGVSVAYLNRRATKETLLPRLRLANNTDPLYVQCVLGSEGLLGPGKHLEKQRKAFLKKPQCPRYVLQKWGTEYRRQGYPGVHQGVDSYWIDIVVAEIRANPKRPFVITDVRFENEVACVRGLGGLVMRVSRPAHDREEAAKRIAGGTSAHVSETAVLGVVPDLTVYNHENRQSEFLQSVLAAVASPSATPSAIAEREPLGSAA